MFFSLGEARRINIWIQPYCVMLQLESTMKAKSTNKVRDNLMAMRRISKVSLTIKIVLFLTGLEL